MNGQIISTSAEPEAFWVYISDLRKKYPVVSIEYSLGQIMIVRVKSFITDEKSAIKGQSFGKITIDNTGCYMERTFKPRYFPDDDEVRSVKNE